MISIWILHIIRGIIYLFISIYHGKHVAWTNLKLVNITMVRTNTQLTRLQKSWKPSKHTRVAYLVFGSASYLKGCSLGSWLTYLWFLDNLQARRRKFSVSYSWLTFSSKAKTDFSMQLFSHLHSYIHTYVHWYYHQRDKCPLSWIGLQY